MVSRTCKSGRAVLHGVFMSALALMAFVMGTPQLALAEETTQTIDGTMTITMFDGGTSGGAGTTTTTTTATSSTATGDALIWLVLGVAILIAGAVYIFIKSRRLATNTGAHASAGTDVDASSKKKTIIVAVVTALIACMCFGMHANKGVAFAKDTLSNIFGSSAVVVDEDGNVLSNAITVVNGEDEAITVKSIEAPADLSDWNADIANKTIESGAVAEGEWYASTIPVTLLEQLKNNNGYAELTFTMNVEDAKTPLDFDKFLIGEGAKDYTYTGQQITPSVTSLVYGDEDFEVTYGENINAGIGTVTIKGIGGYKGEKTFTFTIEPFSIESKTVTISEEGTTYTGDQLKPKVTIDGLVEGTDFEVAYGVNKTAGTDAGMVTVIGKGNYTSSQTKTFDIHQASILSKTVTISKEGTTYTGSQLRPTVSIEGLVENTDFTVSYGDNVSAGSNAGSVTVSGIGNYTDSHILNFDIAKAKPAVVEPTGVTASVGQTLAEVSIPAQVAPNVPGTFTWEGDTSIKFDTVGEITRTAKFIPADTANYEEVTGISITLSVVNKSVYAVYSSDDNSLNFYNRVKPSSEEITSNGSSVTEVYEGFDKDTYTRGNQVPWYNIRDQIKTVNVVDEGIQPESTAYWFYYAKALSSADLSNLDTSKVTTMQCMFSYALISSLDVSGFNTSKVTNMNGMFYYCYRLSSINGLSSFDTSQVENMRNMFSNCWALEFASETELASWETKNVMTMERMFFKCKNLKADCSGWTVGSVTKWDNFNYDAPGVKAPAKFL